MAEREDTMFDFNNHFTNQHIQNHMQNVHSFNENMRRFNDEQQMQLARRMHNASANVDLDDDGESFEEFTKRVDAEFEAYCKKSKAEFEAYSKKVKDDFEASREKSLKIFEQNCKDADERFEARRKEMNDIFSLAFGGFKMK